MVEDMTAPVYLAIAVLAVTLAAATLSFVSFGVFRHRAALWLSLVLAGLVWFGLTTLVATLEALPGLALGPPGLRLLWQALGAVFLVQALPRFALTALGTPVGAAGNLVLHGLTAATAALSVLRVATGWTDRSNIPEVPNLLLEILLFAVIGGTLGMTMLLQSRLPDRGLYRTVVAQAGLIALMVPLVLLEDLGVIQVPGFPLLAGQLLLVFTSAATARHAVTSLMRPKYMAGPTPSPYFMERFAISPRELEVVKAVLEGRSNKEMADRLFISPRTVEKHLSNVYQKVGVKSRLQLYTLLRSEAL